MDVHSGDRLSYCRECEKWFYGSRKVARRISRRLYPDKSLQAYRCPSRSEMWHLGHRVPARQRRAS